MTTATRELLDATDTTRRTLQHGAIFAGVALLALANVLINAGRHGATAAAIVIGLVLFVAASRVKQRWEVEYEGHRIRYENNPFLGEKLFIDDEFAAKGKIGYRSELRAKIKAGTAAGTLIVASSEAGLFSFRCRIVAEPSDAPTAIVGTMTDEQLLAEVRRRGLERS